MKTRFLGPELLDRDNVPEPKQRAAFAFMRFINRFFGGTRVILDYFASHPIPECFSVLDLGSGGGDIPYALSHWAQAQGKKVEITAIDLNPFCVEYARENFKRPSVWYTQASAFDFESLGKFDYITASMFYHHLTDEDIVRLMILVNRRARRGFIVNDLYRSWPAYCGAVALAAPTFQHINLNDAPLSVKRAFKEKDFETYRQLANIPNAKIERKPVFRITLSHHA